MYRSREKTKEKKLIFAGPLAGQLPKVLQLFLAGESQGHIVENAFNVLANNGFLRDQGILTLESVQQFYAAIGQDPKRATLMTPNLLDVCCELGSHELVHRPVITLRKIIDGQDSFHAVAVKSYERNEEYLDPKTIDSLSKTDETQVECQTLGDGETELIELSDFPDQWCLAAQKCYYFQLNGDHTLL